MADVRCPRCGKSNPVELDTCEFCEARLSPLSASQPIDSQPINVSADLVKTNTPEFEKVIPVEGDLVQLGQAPTRENAAELEPTLPSWLPSLRDGQDSAGGKSTAEASPDQGMPLEPTPGADADWLSGLGKVASDDEEVPDWLAGLRSESAAASAPESVTAPDPALNTTGSFSDGLGDTDWEARLGGEQQPSALETAPPGEAETHDRLEFLKSEPAVPGKPEQPVAQQDKEIPDWLSGSPGNPDATMPVSGQAENLPDWLNQLKEKAIGSEPAQHGDEEATVGSDVPEWLSAFGSAPGTPDAAPGESLPEWLSNLDANAGPESTAPASIFSSDLPSSSAVRDETPNWLSQFQVDINTAEEQEAKKEQLEEAPPMQAKNKETEPLPDWLERIKPATTTSGGIPALIAHDEATASEEEDNAAFSMETPDWLSKLKPEKTEEKAPEEDAKIGTPENLEMTELPSWVQAMRPLESVVAEANAPSQVDALVIESGGPLAGLNGVLPVGPGLGLLRKPPAYPTILQVTSGQQRYAAAFERLISSETQPQVAKSARLSSNRVWRWLIAGILILAAGLPLLTSFPLTQASKLRPPEMVAAFTVINSLLYEALNAPVLVVFDYDPAFSGELEAAAAPLMDNLLLQGPRLALISTSPTGPVLAERLLDNARVSALVAGHNYQPGQQYVNLGYLAGGPSGVQYFAISPAEAAPFTQGGQPAWQLPPLQGIQKFSDFAAIIVLTDNSDSGRVWIEQTGSMIGNTPMLMVISAQAEPMILPYYDSGQIKGLVTGLAGGEAYEMTFVRPEAQTGLAQRYWNSFSASTLVAELLIIIGAVWNAVTGWRTSRDKSREGV